MVENIGTYDNKLVAWRMLNITPPAFRGTQQRHRQPHSQDLTAVDRLLIATITTADQILC